MVSFEGDSMANHSRLPGPLSLEGNSALNWKRFIQEFDIYLVSEEKTGKKDEIKIALLLHCGGRELLDIYNTLPASVSEVDKKIYKSLVRSFDEHFEPKNNSNYVHNESGEHCKQRKYNADADGNRGTEGRSGRETFHI